jgi:hypothetical protein
MEASIDVSLEKTPSPFLTQNQALAIIIFSLVAIAGLFGYLLGKWVG